MPNRWSPLRVSGSVIGVLVVFAVGFWFAGTTLGGFAVGGLVSDGPTHASAYVKFDGIEGETKDNDHKGWSDLASFSQSMVSSGGGTGAGRRSGDVAMEDIVLTIEYDKASPSLALAALKGDVFPNVEIHLTGPSLSSQCQGTYLIYELQNAQVVSHSTNGSSIEPVTFPGLTSPGSGSVLIQTFAPLVDAPLVQMSLRFEVIKVTYTECDDDGDVKSTVGYSWNVEEGAPTQPGFHR